jgi:nucleoid-associated protein YgaU
MPRYQRTNIKKLRDVRKHRYQTTIYEKVPESNDDLHFIAVEGDRCDNLAFRFYGTTDLWWFIARVNNLKTMNIEKGTKLRIPTSAERAKGF